MITRMRAKDLICRLLNKREDYESCKAYSERLRLPITLTYGRLNKMKDVGTGLLYQILKGNGYVLMAYNPEPPEGMAKTYIIDNTYAPVHQRTKNEKKITIRRDPYTNELFRKKRRYKKEEYKKFRKVN